VILAVDASAVVAIALREPERLAFLEQLGEADQVFMTPVNITEAGLAIVLRQNLLGLDEFAAWLAGLRVAELQSPETMP
jgi:ribonuclease VapC